jgi:hypothetical protein
VGCINEIDLDIDVADEKIVINCMHQRGSAIRVYAHNLSLLDQNPQKYVRLKMRLLDDGIDLGAAILRRDSVYCFSQKFDETASIEIIDTLTSKTYIGRLENLDIVNINEAIRYPEIIKYDPETPDSDEAYVLHKVTFTDQKGVDNYYQICLKSGDMFDESVFINSAIFTKNPSDPQRILFTDKLFKDKSITLNIYALSWCETAVLRNVSKSYFDYFKSLESHFESQNVFYYDETPLDYFFQPMPVALYSNETNGLGAFVSYSESQIPFKVHSSED